jgi:iron complex transport system ATP-binding protein
MKTARAKSSKTTDTAVLRVQGLKVQRGGVKLLDGVDWRVGCGEHWVVLGANGCGKTSLLKTLLGYLTPSAGEIDVLGERYGGSDWRELRRRIGMVSSALQAAVPPHETALETVVSGRTAQLDLWETPTRAEAAVARRQLARAGAGGLAERHWGVLSQGERQRVLIARALMARPRLLILDEPCAGMDPVARERFLARVERIGRERGAPSLVLVTHHVEEITPVFTHVLLLKAGRVLAAGPREEILGRGAAARLGETFGARLRLARRAGRFWLEVAGAME